MRAHTHNAHICTGMRANVQCTHLHRQAHTHRVRRIRTGSENSVSRCTLMAYVGKSEQARKRAGKLTGCMCVCVCVCVESVVHVRTWESRKESLFDLGARQREPVEINGSDLPQEVHQPAANRTIVYEAHACCLHVCVRVCVCVCT